MLWCTKEARALRRKSSRALGPWGLFTSLAYTPQGRWIHGLFETSLTVCVFCSYLALVSIPEPQSVLWVIGAVTSGRLVVVLFPRLEGLDDSDYLGLEPAGVNTMREDLRDWVDAERVKMEASGKRTCDECAEFEARQGVCAPTALTMAIFLDYGAQFNKVEEGLHSYDRRATSFHLHPEGPMLDRRKALHDVAWRLTQIAKAAGLGPAD